MNQYDSRVDAYIEKSAPFARPILEHLRRVVHAACPDIEEDIKWGMPFFLYHGLLCHMGAFKRHVAFGFFNSSRVLGEPAPADGMGSFGKITALADLPPEVELAAHIKKAMELKVEAPKKPAKPKQKIEIVEPEYFLTALRKNRKALATYEKFSPGNKRDYVEWITEAKTEATRQMRLATALEWMQEGKVRNWKYIK